MMLHVTKLLLIVAVSSEEWLSIQRGVRVDVNLDDTPLQILTNSTVGDGEFVRLSFVDSFRKKIYIEFGEGVYVTVRECVEKQKIDLLDEQPIVWTLVRDREEEVMRLLQKGVEVFVVDYSSQGPCSNLHAWGNEEDMSYFKFMSQEKQRDSASDAYRPLPIGI